MKRLGSPLLALAFVALAAALLALGGRDAGANVAYDSPYTYEQTFGSALRLVRVDLGLKLVEKDQASGYLMFEYKSPESGKRVSSGSIEIVKNQGNVHVAVQLPEMPRYHEQMMIDALVKKLVAEHGEPPRHPRPEPPVDAGDGAGGGDAGS
jgi:hypothetical protein